MRSIFLYVFILISCESKVDTHQSNMELLDDVVNIHDELMVKMKDLKSLKNELTQDGVESDNQLILELDNARSSMMKFMKKFSEDFQFDKYPMDRESYKDIDEKGLSIVNDKLKGQKKIVLEVSELFETSIANAEAAIKN
mgnify:FL=1